MQGFKRDFHAQPFAMLKKLSHAFCGLHARPPNIL
jgi:hypothetical protein